jgi:quinol monooxygenase YgiN
MRAPVERALLAIVEPARAEPGCIEIHLCRALRDPATFFIQSAWAGEGEFEKHAELPHMTAFDNRLSSPTISVSYYFWPRIVDSELRIYERARAIPFSAMQFWGSGAIALGNSR